MTNHAATLEQWHEGLAKALHDRAFDAIPVILVRMARDGWGHEAEQARQLLAAPRPAPLGVRLGHDPQAHTRLTALDDAYREAGLDTVRRLAHAFVTILGPAEIEALLVEGVLHAAQPRDRQRAEAQAAFDRAETADDAAAVRRGGGR